MQINITQRYGLPIPNDTALEHMCSLVRYIIQHIDVSGGWMPFDRYMKLALYASGLGYYSNSTVKFGHSPDDGSDFITASELTPLFAQTFAKPVAEILNATNTSHVVEFGAGTGKFASVLLRTLDELGIECTRYTIIELSDTLRERQHKYIAETAERFIPCVQWVNTIPERVDGVIVGNEVLDAMPVRIFARQDSLWYERGVSVIDASRFVFADRPLIPALIPATLAYVPNEHDYVTETHEAATKFVYTVCSALGRGAALFVDYGFPAAEYYHPQRTEGTLMCHYQHHAHSDPFLYPGLQDITAHVQFSAIKQAARIAGAHLLGYTSQAHFLINAGITDLLMQLDPTDSVRFLPKANIVQKLLSESEMGELFKVIAFCRGFDARLAAFKGGDRSHTL
ncbi:class I SAM-dependent methyltransferase [Candidatus Vallotia lariciata]|uniref:class I SAM-dependent methyltransferase n=1 Tax=Candidatus Vallotia laricis TaxID=2018052 RepID=UPI001D0270B0|nr:class I SAM-dependent methyltransferase [Candidatus Vallotia lariciata]UDG82705.1 class I SAM-dependent methyltransferase [Candidatus Vallotia lariciata]